MEIANYVENGGRRVTPAKVEAFRQKLPALMVKVAEMDSVTFPHLQRQLEFLMEVFEDFADGLCKDVSYRAFGELVFALNYALKGDDIIPDAVPEVGLTDDSSVVRAVLIRFEPELSAYAASKGIDWTCIGSHE